MTTSKAMATLEERHAYLISKFKETRSSYVIAEAVAVEHALDALAEKLLRDRVARAARHAMLQQLPGASC
jgi:hypothetical protein